MKKKTPAKRITRKPARKVNKKGHYVEFFGLGIGMLIGISLIAGFRTSDPPNVLGISVFQAEESAAPTITPEP